MDIFMAISIWFNNVPVMLIPISGSDITIKVNDIGSYFNDAFKCQFANINVRKDDQCDNNLFCLMSI